ncbi:hypothetical protein HDU86_004647 [Geranomyces michiganensis]|nr:hypothetical protein HDU86_004647 [Geranomyces michiganensis]
MLADEKKAPLLSLPAPASFAGVVVVTPPANATPPSSQQSRDCPPWSSSPVDGGGVALAATGLSPPPMLTLTRPFTAPDPGTLVPPWQEHHHLPAPQRRQSSELSLPPLPSPTFSELFYLEGEGPRTPMPQIMLTPADGPASTFWGTEDVLEPGRMPSTPYTPTSMFNDRPRWQYAVSYHEPGYPDEIAVSVGDKLEVYKQYQDGWILGYNHTTKKKGIFPGGCVNHLVPHAGSSAGGIGVRVGGTTPPPFMSSSSRQDSTSAMSFTSSASKWLYGPPEDDSDVPPGLSKPLDGQPRSRSRSRDRHTQKITTGGIGSASLLHDSSSRTLHNAGGSRGASATHQLVEVDPKRAPPSARRLRLVHTWERVRKPILVTVLMVVAISLVLGLGLGFGKVRAPPERNSKVLASM